MAGIFRFSFGPWNIHEGADPFGPPVREPIEFWEKMEFAARGGFEGIQFHDDDAVDLNLSFPKQEKKLRELKSRLNSLGLEAEFIAPRLWEDPLFVDGGFTANDPKIRERALARSKRAVDIARMLGTKRIVLWPAREGTYCREAKDAKVAIDYFLEYINALLEYDKEIKILGEMKPNEPMDSCFSPTTGHFLALGGYSADPERVGVLIESAHAVLANLEPSEEMGLALALGKLWGIHLNDQNNLKFDQDKTFGSVNLRRAFSQVYLLDKYNYGHSGEYVGLDIKVMRTQTQENSLKHLIYSKDIFLMLLEKVRSVDEVKLEELRQSRDYEELDFYITKQLLGRD
jgi:xylose isomerase